MAWPEGDLAGFADFDSIQGEHVIAFFVGGHDDGRSQSGFLILLRVVWRSLRVMVYYRTVYTFQTG